ncbi:monocarboxylate transporter 13-like [Lytechinus pictus]|uniref:monocarboxylate transporter 13-like n=1 Tax=Lytechinus pictus TaxID=7653 RepID=UPI0030B9F8BC
MVNCYCNMLCNRGEDKKMENGTALGHFKPIPGEPDGPEPTQISDSSVSLCKRLWIDPMYFRWITTVVWAIGIAVTFGVVGDFSMFFIYLEREFEASVTKLSLLGGLPWFLTCFFSPLANQIVNWVGYRSTMVGGCFICSIGLFTTSFIHELWPAFITYSLMVGGSAVVVYTAGCVYITEYFDKKHCSGPVSSNGLAFEISILVFSPVIQTTASTWGWRWSIRLISFFSLCATFLYIVFIRKPPKDMFVDDDDYDVVDDKKAMQMKLRDREKDEKGVDGGVVDEEGQRQEKDEGETGEQEEEGKEEKKEIKHWKASFRRYVALLKMPAFSLFLIGTVISFTALSFNLINFGSYLISVGVSDEKTALFHSFMAGASLVARVSVLFIHLLPFSILLTYPTISAISCGASVIILLVTPQWVFYLYSILTGAMRGLYFSLSTGMAVELSGRDKAAEAYALTFAAWGIGSIVAAVLPAITHRLTGSYKVSMIMCIAFWGLSAILFLIVYLLNRRTQRKRLSSKSSVEGGKKESLLPSRDVRKELIVSTAYSPLPDQDTAVV